MFFTGVNYYDGQGFIVRKKLGVDSALKLDGASVCVQQGTTTELNLADYFRAHNMKFEAVVFATDDETVQAYDGGRCDAYTTDASGLYAERLKMSRSPTTTSCCPRSSPRSRSGLRSARTTSIGSRSCSGCILR